MPQLTQPSLSERLNRDRSARAWRVEHGFRFDDPGTTGALARGGSPATPFLPVGSVAFFVLCAVAVLTLATLTWWLV